MAKKLWHWISTQVLAETPQLYKARRFIESKIDEERRSAEERIGEHLEVAEGLSSDSIERYEQMEHERKRSIENKAKNNLLGVTLAFSILSMGAGLWAREKWTLEGVSDGAFLPIGLMLIALVYFLWGGGQALSAMRVGQSYQIRPADEASLPAEEFKALRLWYLELNQQVTTLRTNALSVSFRSIRNGIIALALAACAALISL